MGKEKLWSGKETMFGTYEFPTPEEIVDDYSREFQEYIQPKGENIFGFWMQTIADIEFLDLELAGLTEKYKIDPVSRTVEMQGDLEFIRMRIAHLERVGGGKTLYAEFVDTFGDTNAYAFHNLYPYKGKFYPRVVRTLINAFKLDKDSLLLDPFNGSGTTTHEASLMGIRSVGVDITPVGVMLARLKNDLVFKGEDFFALDTKDLVEIFREIENKRWEISDNTLKDLMLVLYFDTIDAFMRTSSYDKTGKVGLFIKKFNYIKSCYLKTKEIRDRRRE